MILAKIIKICLMIANDNSTPNSEKPSILKWYEIVMLGKKQPEKIISMTFGFSNGILQENL